MKNYSLKLALPLLAALLGVASCRPAQAATVGYNVVLNTAPLANVDRNNDSAQDAFRLDFYFNNGGTVGNSSLTSSNFTFGGGTGTAVSAATITDKNPTTDANFLPVPGATGTLTNPGTTLNFHIDFNYSVDTPVSDNFSFALFNTSLNDYVYTDGSADSISLFHIDFTSGGPVLQTYASSDYGLAAPSVTATPEPATWAMMALGLASLSLLGAKKRKNKIEAL